MTRGVFSLIAIAAVVSGGCAGSGSSGPTVNDQGFLFNVGEGEAVLDGYDVVAYHEQQIAAKGSAELQVRHRGSLFFFTSADNRGRFNGQPDRFTSEFGGFCAMGVASGELHRADPEVFAVIDNSIYVFRDTSALSEWHGDATGNATRARLEWPRLVAEAKRRTALGG